jgi:predicted aspartyl protease
MIRRRFAVVSAIVVSVLMSPVSAQEFGTFIPMREKGSATYYVTTEIHGLGAVDLMVDTGSSYTTINEETLAVLLQQQRADYVSDLEGMLADGTRLMLPIYSIKSMNIGGQCPLRDIEVAVFPGNTRQILGLSTLRQASPFIFSMNPPQLVLSNCIGGIDGRADVAVPAEPVDAVNQEGLASPS